MTTNADLPGTRRRTVGIVVALVLLFGVVGAGLAWTSVRSTDVRKPQTTDETYCSTIRIRSFSDLVATATEHHDYGETVLLVMPNHGPPEVNDDVVKVRAELTVGDYEAAAETSRSLDQRTPDVCP